MKFPAVLLLACVIGCGTISVPCDAVGTVAQEGATYLCDILSHKTVAGLSSMGESEKVVTAEQYTNLSASVDGMISLAIAQSRTYAADGNDAQAQKIIDAVHLLSMQQDSLHVFIKVLKGK